jgi:DNA-binding NarL/FixJ family response regulator
MLRITLLGLPDDMAGPIAKLLADGFHQVSRKLLIQDLARGERAGVVFISGDCAEYRENLRQLRESNPGVPVVVATRHPDDRKWLDALDDGAADYCSAPFDRRQIEWILHSVCPQSAAAAAS